MDILEPFDIDVEEKHLNAAIDAVHERGWSTFDCIFAQAAKDVLKEKTSGIISTGRNAVDIHEEETYGEEIHEYVVVGEEEKTISEIVGLFDNAVRGKEVEYSYVEKIRAMLPVRLHLEFSQAYD